MARWSIYGVFLPDQTWGMTTNKARALKKAREARGYVKSVPYAGSPSSWDGPTFRLCSDFVADYREES